MKNKIYRLLAIFVTFVFLLSGCGGSDDKSVGSSGGQKSSAGQTEVSDSSSTEAVVEEAAEGYEIFGGQMWKVGAIYYRNKVIDIHDNASIESMYDSTYLDFSSDGHFLYLDLFPKEGSYEPYAGDGKNSYFLLKTEKTMKYDSDKGELVESESASNKSYIISVLDENTFEFVEFDPLTGKAKANENPLIFVKSSAESSFIQNNKTEIAQNEAKSSDEADHDSGKSDDSQEYTAGGGTYQDILDEYTEKMEEAVPGLVSEYRSESAGVSDIEKLAEICNDKVGELAEICNEGVGKMAELMQKNGDSYDTYEMWAGKLMDNYTDIAGQIQDAYLESAMN